MLYNLVLDLHNHKVPLILNKDIPDLTALASHKSLLKIICKDWFRGWMKALTDTVRL